MLITREALDDQMRRVGAAPEAIEEGRAEVDTEAVEAIRAELGVSNVKAINVLLDTPAGQTFGPLTTLHLLMLGAALERADERTDEEREAFSEERGDEDERQRAAEALFLEALLGA